MLDYDRRVWIFAASMSALAGYIDAVGFIHLGGFFVSFMSGNSTRLAVGIVDNASFALMAGSLIAQFLVGVFIGSLVAHWAGPKRKLAVLALVTVALLISGSASGISNSSITISTMVMAMGAINCVFQRNGEVSIGITYMTGTLVKVGQRLAGAVMGYDSWAWLPYSLLWFGLMAGAVSGAFAYSRLGIDAIWIAAAMAALLTCLVRFLGLTLIYDQGSSRI